jgi:hypothetical protein
MLLFHAVVLVVVIVVVVMTPVVFVTEVAEVQDDRRLTAVAPPLAIAPMAVSVGPVMNLLNARC